jgi:hypothetical protein
MRESVNEALAPRRESGGLLTQRLTESMLLLLRASGCPIPNLRPLSDRARCSVRRLNIHRPSTGTWSFYSAIVPWPVPCSCAATPIRAKRSGQKFRNLRPRRRRHPCSTRAAVNRAFSLKQARTGLKSGASTPDGSLVQRHVHDIPRVRRPLNPCTNQAFDLRRRLVLLPSRGTVDR